MVSQSFSSVAHCFPHLSVHCYVFLNRPVNGQFKEFLKGNFDFGISFILHMRKVWLKEISKERFKKKDKEDELICHFWTSVESLV